MATGKLCCLIHPIVEANVLAVLIGASANIEAKGMCKECFFKAWEERMSQQSVLSLDKKGER